MTTFIEISLFILIGVGSIYFVYESIIMPSVRLRIRYKLFGLRDELRFAKYKEGNAISDEAFKYLQESLNVSLAFLSKFDIATLSEMKQIFKQHPELLKRAENRNEIIESCQNAKFQCINNRRLSYMRRVFLANSLLGILAFSPFVLTWIVAKKFNTYLREKKILGRLSISIPEREFNRLALG